MRILIRKPLPYVIVSALVGIVSVLAVLFGPSWGSTRTLAPEVAEGSSLAATPSPPVALPALPNMMALATSPNTSAVAQATGATAEQKAFQSEIGDLTLPSNAPPEWATGNLVPSQARALMTDVGSMHGTIYAIPTSKGRVCSGLSGYSSGCTDGFRDILGDITTTFGSGVVWGLAPNQVVAIDVVVDGVSHSARLENNAYFFEGGNPQQLIVYFKDGTRKTVSYPTLPSSG